MLKVLTNMFVDYGKSNGVYIILTSIIFLVVGLIFGIAAIILAALRFNCDIFFYTIHGILIILALISFIVGIFKVDNDVTKNVKAAISQEYENAEFLKDKQFISNDIRYIYEISKDRKLNIYMYQSEKETQKQLSE